MLKTYLLLTLCSFSVNLHAQIDQYQRLPLYSGNDLGLTLTPASASVVVWSPTAEAAELRLYKSGDGDELVGRFPMRKLAGGIMKCTLEGDRRGLYYTVRVRINGEWLSEVADPYAKVVGVNGRRAMIADLSESNPEAWASDKSPGFVVANDAIIYEIHLRDISINENSGIKAKGKYLGLTESGTSNGMGASSGLDHLKELGVTHVHLLPFFDFLSLNERRPDSTQYNWGYDPLNYNAAEGSYATDAMNGLTRIRELKQLIAALHKNGQRVVMDVVYNHTGSTESSTFNQLVPGYYYRHGPGGQFSNATACGNETASERPMMRKYMLESLKYWVKEYHIDGFRFDLMGVHDIETMNLISQELHKIKPGILLYGEGWTAGASPLAETKRAIKANASHLKNIAVFSDDIRDGIKGSVFNEKDRGFATGATGLEESIKFGIVASCKHSGIDYAKVNYSKAPYASAPAGTINYADCHDNHILWDKINLSTPGVNESDRRAMHKLALSIVLTSQGIPFLHAGTEFLRTKRGHENSYNAGDSINGTDWQLKSKNRDVYDYVRGLIAMRRTHPAFRIRTVQAMEKNLQFTMHQAAGTVAYTINGAAVGDKWKKIFIAFNGTGMSIQQELPNGNWQIFAEHNSIVAEVRTAKSDITLTPFSCVIAYQE